MAVVAGYKGAFYLTATPSVALGAPEAFTDTGDHIHYVYSTHRYWDKTATFTVQGSPNGSSGWVTETDYTVQWPIGQITFNTARTSGNNNLFTQVSVGSYFTSTVVADAYDWTLNEKAEQADVTVFSASNPFHTRIATLISGTIKVKTWKGDGGFQGDLLNLLVASLYVDTTVGTGTRFEGYAWMTLDTYQAMVKNANMQDFTFDTEGPFYYVPS